MTLKQIKQESCLEYYKRRLKEGWKEISREGYKVILLSPEGIKKELDLRNDVLILRPNAPGDETGIGGEHPSGEPHYTLVDDETPDDDDTYVGPASPDEIERDLYNLTNTSQSGTINKITLYIRVKGEGCVGDSVKGVIKSGNTISETEWKDPYTDFGHKVWGTYSFEWTTNPDTGQPWTWEDINNLQAGVVLRSVEEVLPPIMSMCTQVYVEVDYTPAGGARNLSLLGVGN